MILPCFGAGAVTGKGTLVVDGTWATELGVAVGAASDMLSPSSSNMAIAELTATAAVPSAINSLPIIPSSTASNSIVALSVSISARISPELTLSPSATSHFANVPSSIVGERAGIKISIAMVKPPPVRKYLSKVLLKLVQGSLLRIQHFY